MKKMRLIVRVTDFGAAANIGGPIEETVRTFEMGDLPVEFVKFWEEGNGRYGHAQVMGVEVFDA